ncbi:hypothetical protein LTR10_016483 [Elasticomyces elasticus]|uniref:FAD-binding PCMH-type domain-containing protein n=1 Tax=Exophiala sideris TaxID=1016849 RepID=A0ABR0JKP0_9EURO|nr:hypothetical protein LTR10_016483 [Elasticomyces elasticus]KAK5032122.1 hypothetical protein LTR13_007339 [Exophiala sideris]KAK5036120.1 hypothetical protein LTS07_001845 [Exophiala sideris]KAK5066502.1 hypothetical protein LTR69_001848 [Exophiala sideris]KAK5180324.1 hypothetical protein LTR44_007081 [Eurotiomycetes sp. CCFEE 6388]
MADYSHTNGLEHESTTSVTDCILGLRHKINDNELPGLTNLINDWFDPKVDVDEEQFVRRFLHVFKQSDKDFTCEKIIGDYDDEVQGIFNDFSDGRINAHEAAQRYQPYKTEKLPKQKGELRKGGLPSILPENVNTEASLLAAFPSSIPSRFRSLVAKVIPATKRPKRALYIPSFKDLVFQNWGRTVSNTPAFTCVPNTSQDVCDIVKYAKKHNMGVRVSGFRHSWSPVFGRSDSKKLGNNGDVLISTLGLVDASVLPNFTSLPGNLFEPRAEDLNSIVVVDNNFVRGPKLTDGKKYVRVGTSTTNEQLRRWCINTGKVTPPMNIIEVEITMGGSNGTICHGAGINNPTLSDLVRAIEYVDANGALRKVDMSTPDILRAAAGCFGLIGVVTHLVLVFDVLSCALLEPRKVPVIEAIPPPPDMPDSAIPSPLRPKQPLSAQRKAEIQKDFETRALTTDYAEWFWFPLSSEVWVNTWHKTSDVSGAVNYPSDAKTILQVFGTVMVNIAQNADTLLKATEFVAETQTKLLTWLAMKNLDDIGPHGKKIKTWLPDALHFQRGVQNVRVRDLEVEFPLQPKNTSLVDGTFTGTPNGHVNGTVVASTTNTKEIDFTVVQRAWWDAIITCYSATKTCPQRMPLEMRIMSSSQVTLAPQRGHTLGTCSIEILTLHEVADIWQPYAQTVLDKWSSYKTPQGQSIPVRPHWAKEWYGYNMRGRPWQDVLRTEDAQGGGCRNQIEEWRGLIGRLASRDRWTVGDARFRFGNEVLDQLFWEDVKNTVSTSTTPSSIKAARPERKKSLGKRLWQSCFG